MTTELGTWLRTEREEHAWSRAELAQRMIRAAREAGDKTMPDGETIRGYIYRWEKGITRNISERYVHHYCRVFQVKFTEFGRPREPEADAAVVPSAAVLPPGAGVPFANLLAYRGVETPESRQPTVRHEVLMAAHEGSEHAAHVEQRGVGDTTLEQLREDITRLSAEFCTGQPLAVFLELRRVRERVFRILDRQLWPREQAELYFFLGVINGLMGAVADDLGYPDSAVELIRSGWAYAVAIDHRPLLANLRLELASVAYRRGMTLRSRDLAADGLRYLDAGPAAADLNLKLARAHAVLGDADLARQAVNAAHEAREREHRDEVLEIGGEFAMSLATHHRGAGTALIEIVGAESDAAAEIEEAVSLYEEGPRPGELHGVGVKALASIDLSVVRLRSGALDAATAALQPVLSLPPAQRIAALDSRLKRVRAELAAPIFSRSAEARNLNERIEDFTSDSVTAGLHALPGGPA
jgi:transcriptional regulator with XRE-family HTH domain